MSLYKKKIRQDFRTKCLERDNYKCVFCGKIETENSLLDVHHIQDRTLIANGGYTKENGITLCKDHHFLAEQFHSTGIAHPGFSPEDLYKKIGSSYEQAVAASERL